MLKKLLKVWLGGKSISPSNVLGLDDFIASVRTALVVALCVGGLAAIEDFDAREWGPVDTIISSGAVALAEALRRYLKDYQS